MKKTMLLTALFIISLHSFAQDGPLNKGSLKLNASLGLASYVGVAGGNTTFPPLTGSLEYAVNENTTVGPVLGYAASEQNINYSYIGESYTITYSDLLIGAKANHYFNVDKKYDLYAGVFLGYNVVNVGASYNSQYGTFSDNNDYGSSLLYGFQVGGRYKFSPNLAVHAELSYGIAALNIGLTFSLGNK